MKYLQIDHNNLAFFLLKFQTSNQTSQAIVDQFGKENELKIKKTIEFSSDKKYSAIEFDKKGVYALGNSNLIFSFIVVTNNIAINLSIPFSSKE